MKAFMDENFLLSTATAEMLYHDFAANLPIIDYHCHINPAEIAADRRFKSITDVWLGGDHYKWRVMRANGVEERYITGEGDDFTKFLSFASVMPKLAGSPLYHWAHLELKRFFGYDGVLNAASAREVYEHCNARLAEPSLSVRGMIRRMNVELICTTDDPTDSLEHHRALAEEDYETRVLPAFRPDRAVNITDAGFSAYIAALERASGIEITGFDALCDALSERLDYFGELGCRISDHGLTRLVCALPGKNKPDGILKEALAGHAPDAHDAEVYQTALLLFLAREYHRRGMVMQLHFGALRNNSPRMFAALGPDTGFDAMNDPGGARALSDFLGILDREGSLPRMIVYSLNPYDNEMITAMLGCFQQGTVPGKLQHGSAWWFNDTLHGMTAQLTNLAATGVLGNFIGMLTDSRSFLSYTRHEYFRRILADFLGRLVEDGQYPLDIPALKMLMEDICHHNAERYFFSE